jgi:hypothetical protein
VLLLAWLLLTLAFPAGACLLQTWRREVINVKPFWGVTPAITSLCYVTTVNHIDLTEFKR